MRGVGHDGGVPYTYEIIQGNAINCRSWLASEEASTFNINVD